MSSKADPKFRPTPASASDLIDKIDSEPMRDDCHALIRLMKKITGADPVVWGGNIIGFGKYHYKYESGHEGDACLAGFSPRKQNLTVYMMPGFADTLDLSGLGKFKASKGCLYLKKLSDVDMNVLERLIRESVTTTLQRYKKA